MLRALMVAGPSSCRPGSSGGSAPRTAGNVAPHVAGATVAVLIAASIALLSLGGANTTRSGSGAFELPGRDPTWRTKLGYDSA